ncbi:hypothetical protein YC2023_098703 [Brassica napus]
MGGGAWPFLVGGAICLVNSVNERDLSLEFQVSASHQLALTTSLPFVHTACRSYRLNDPVKRSDRGDMDSSPSATSREVHYTLSFRGRRSRNKVSVGEPAEGSLSYPINRTTENDETSLSLILCPPILWLCVRPWPRLQFRSDRTHSSRISPNPGTKSVKDRLLG